MVTQMMGNDLSMLDLGLRGMSRLVPRNTRVAAVP